MNLIGIGQDYFFLKMTAYKLKYAQLNTVSNRRRVSVYTNSIDAIYAKGSMKIGYCTVSE
ncbi:hypothetical protein HMSSN036_29890 [Paenibacillus macerans]|nr:hypothetical protein HMSSN036_29890 [Paenibacillus macerans]